MHIYTYIIKINRLSQHFSFPLFN